MRKVYFIIICLSFVGCLFEENDGKEYYQDSGCDCTQDCGFIYREQKPGNAGPAENTLPQKDGATNKPAQGIVSGPEENHN